MRLGESKHIQQKSKAVSIFGVDRSLKVSLLDVVWLTY